MMIDSKKLIDKFRYEIIRWQENIEALDKHPIENLAKTIEAEAVVMAFNQSISIIQREIKKQFESRFEHV